MAIVLITLGIMGTTGTSLAGRVEYDVTLYLEDDNGPMTATGTASWPGLGVELRWLGNPTVTVGGIVMDLHGFYLTRRAGKIIAVGLFFNDAAGDLYRIGDGKNEAGEEVASGIYFYSITTGGFSATRKMTVRK